MKTKNRVWFYPLILMGLVLILSSCKKKEEATSAKITDKDGNVYTSVTIGTQVWMVENLKTTKYNDGTSIPLVTDKDEWAYLTTPGYCWYDNDVAKKTPYGALYNWYAENTDKLCPTGWHTPSDAELTELTDYLGGESVAGGKLKETGTTHWTTPNTGATNETGFTALPGGSRNYDGTCYDVEYAGCWWSSYSTTYGWGWYVTYSDASVVRNYGDKQNGCSVRCLKDN